MTKQEVKDEYKNQEGDPKVKSQQRQRMQQAARRRMMQSVPEADVVITNPTHFAVALKYDNTVSMAPVVVAKGADYLAFKIKDLAKEMTSRLSKISRSRGCYMQMLRLEMRFHQNCIRRSQKCLPMYIN